MKTIQVTVEKNFHCLNDDRFIMEKISMTVELDGAEADGAEQRAMNWAREEIVQSFKAAYPKVYTHLNFDVVVNERSKDFKAALFQSEGIPFENRMYGDGMKLQNTEPETINKPTIEEPYDIIKEIDSCKSLTVLKIYEKQCKTPEQKDAYDKKVKELEKIKQ